MLSFRDSYVTLSTGNKGRRSTRAANLLHRLCYLGIFGHAYKVSSLPAVLQLLPSSVTCAHNLIRGQKLTWL